MKKWINNNKFYLLGAVLGGIAGTIYWGKVGCKTGTCPISSNPLNSTLYGVLLGGMLFGIFKKENHKKKGKDNNQTESK